MAITRPYRIYIFDATGLLVDIPQDVLSGSFEDLVNGGSGAGTITLPRHFVDTGLINYEYRVQFYLADSIDPWYDGHVVDFDQTQASGGKDSESITVICDGWSTRMGYALTSDSIHPGEVGPDGKLNGLVNADTFLVSLLSRLLDSATFGTSFVASIPIALDKMSFDGTELNKAIDDIIKQVQDGSGNTFEWWVRGKAGGKPQLVIQPNENPNKATTTYKVPPTFTGSTPSAPVPCGFNYEWKNSTITDYKQTNSGRQIYNMVAAYGGNDPITNQQVNGAYKDSISISLYGVRQKKITNSNLVSTRTLNMYATVYLLLNAYPQPQTTFRKLIPTDNDRAGSWYQIFEPSLKALTQSIKQARCVKVTIDFGGDTLSSSMTCTAPRPYIDNAYYAAINQSARAVVFPRSSQLISYFVATGLNWLGSGVNAGQPTVNISPPVGLFGNASPVSLPKGPNADGSYTLTLTDSVTASTGDGRYEVLFANDPLTDFAVLTHSPALLVIKGAPSPYNVRVLRGWEFMVINGALVGSKDLRVYGGISANNINFGNHPAPSIPTVPTLGTGFTSNSVHAQVLIPPFTIINPLSDTTVRGVYFVYRLHGSTDNALKPIGGLDLSSLTNASQTVGPYGFEIGAGQAIDVFMGYAGLGDYGPLTQLGNATQIANGFMPASLVVTVPYLAANGPQVPPTITQTGVTAFFTPVTSQNQISAGMAIAFTITNQPTNGTYSRLGIYRSATGVGAWEKYNDIPVPNVATPSVSQPFALTISDLSVGQQFDWGASFEDTQGGETCGNPPSFPDAAHGLIGTSPAATVSIGNTSLAAMPAAIIASGPNITSTNKSVNPIRGGSTISAQDISFLTSEGYPDWMDAVWLITRISTQSTLIGTPNRLTPNSGGSYFPTIAIPAGVVIDVGIYYVGKRGESSSVVWPAGLSAISGVGMSNTSNASMPSALKTSGPVGATYSGLTRLAGGGISITVTLSDFGTPVPGWLKNVNVGIANINNPTAFYSYTTAKVITLAASSITFSVTVFGVPGYTYNVGVWYEDMSAQTSAIATVVTNFTDPKGSFLDPTTGNLQHGRHSPAVRGVINIDGTAARTQDWLPDSGTRFAAIEANADSTTNHQSSDSRQLGGVGSAVHNLDLQGWQTNQIPDSDMRFGTTYWRNTNGAIGGSINQYFVNYWGARTTYWFTSGTTAPASETNFAPLQSSITGIMTTTYTFSAFFTSSGGSTGSFAVIVMSGTTNAEIARVTAAAGTGDQRLSVSFGGPPGGSIYFIIQSNISSVNSSWYVGQFQLELGSTMTSYKTSLVDTQTGYFGRGAHHPDFRNTVNTGGGIDYASGLHVNTLPLNRYDVQILNLQQRNLVKMGRPPYIGGGSVLGKMQDRAGGWKYSATFNNTATVTEILNGTYGSYVCTALQSLVAGYVGLYQDINVKPNTTYSFACNIYLASPSSQASMSVVDPTNNGIISNATGPTGAIPNFYAQLGADTGSQTTTTVSAWRIVRGQFNSGARTTARVLLQGWNATTGTIFYPFGMMVWEGSKWQDYCDGEALPGSINSAHISDISNSTPFNIQGSMSPVLTPKISLRAVDSSGLANGTQYTITSPSQTYAFRNPDNSPMTSSAFAVSDIVNQSAGGPLNQYYVFGFSPVTLMITKVYGPQAYPADPATISQIYQDQSIPMVANIRVSCISGNTSGQVTSGGGTAGGRPLMF